MTFLLILAIYNMFIFLYLSRFCLWRATELQRYHSLFLQLSVQFNSKSDLKFISKWFDFHMLKCRVCFSLPGYYNGRKIQMNISLTLRKVIYGNSWPAECAGPIHTSLFVSPLCTPSFTTLHCTDELTLVPHYWPLLFKHDLHRILPLCLT